MDNFFKCKNCGSITNFVDGQCHNCGCDIEIEDYKKAFYLLKAHHRNEMEKAQAYRAFYDYEKSTGEHIKETLEIYKKFYIGVFGMFLLNIILLIFKI